MMEWRMEHMSPRSLVGMRSTMSFRNNTTAQLWASFMPRRREIPHRTGTELYSVQYYSPGFFERFDPAATFEKWAAEEVSWVEALPNGMSLLQLTGGLYAVFLYKGSSADAAAVFQYIFGTWLPASAYELDDRPHFELLGAKYKTNEPSSEEEIWIPVRPKQQALSY